VDFISDYLEYTAGNEVPRVYHEWSALSVLSSLVGRRVWVDQGIFTLYPNLYVIFVGDPANGKSTAKDIAEEMSTDFEVPIAPDDVTKESLTLMMGKEDSECRRPFKYNGKTYENTQITIYADELLTLLGNDPLSMVKLLTALYSKKGTYVASTKGKGTDIIKCPYVSILGCMTPEITTALIKQSIINGGFNRRCNYVFRNRLDKAVPRPQETPTQSKARQRCMNRGYLIQQLKGGFKWEKGATDFFDDWYETNFIILQQRLDLITKGYYRAKDGMMLRIAMLIQLASSDNLLLTIPSMEKALVLLNDTEKTLHRVFEGAGRNVQSGMAAKLITMLEQVKDNTMTEKEIRVYMWGSGDTDETFKVLAHLISTDRIRKVSKSGKPVYQLIQKDE